MQTNLFTSGQSQNSSAQASNPANNLIGNDPTGLFTKLLVAQIQNQDPLNPTDPSQFVNQMTQLSQMQSLQQLTTLASSNASLLQSMQMLAMGAQVGSQVAVQSDHVTLADQPVQGSFTLQNSSSQVALTLTGPDGSQYHVDLGTQAAGDVPFVIDPAQLGLAPGSYGLSVSAGDGETPAVQIAGNLSSVKVSSTGSMSLNVTNIGEVPATAITQFNGR
jgi:flagellar basal-body rod modification protein FlgD